MINADSSERYVLWALTEIVPSAKMKKNHNWGLGVGGYSRVCGATRITSASQSRYASEDSGVIHTVSSFSIRANRPST